MVGFPPCASNFESKNELKSPAIINSSNSFFGFVSNFSNSTNLLFSTSICSICYFRYQFLVCYQKKFIFKSKQLRRHKKLFFHGKRKYDLWSPLSIFVRYYCYSEFLVEIVLQLTLFCLWSIVLISIFF